MLVFVYEYTCATGGAGGTLAEALHAEGWAMLAAVLADLRAVPGVETVTLLADGVRPAAPIGPIRVPPVEGERAAFAELARQADGTLVIAPETDGILEARCRRVEQCGGRLLGPAAAAVGLAADKLALGRHWRECGVPCPAGWPDQPRSEGGFPYPAVWKPRRGAGSQSTFIVRRPEDVANCRLTAAVEGWCGEAVVQEYVPGQPASAAFLMGPGGRTALPPARQTLSDDGRLRYLGGNLPLQAGEAERAVRLAGRAVDALSGLRGYVGVDLILGPEPDGSGDRAIELNARLTTSYVGLRALAEGNLAAAMLRAAAGEPLPPLAWRPGSVTFTADGTVEVTGG